MCPGSDWDGIHSLPGGWQSAWGHRKLPVFCSFQEALRKVK